MFRHRVRDLLFAALPDQCREQVRSSRYPHFGRFREQGVAFVHVPRTAGTSISHALYGRWVGHGSLRDLETHASVDVLALPRFAIVRNPWDRLVSAWSLARSGRGLGDHGTVTVRNAAQYQTPSFHRFDSFVLEWLAERDTQQLDDIFMRQDTFIVDRDGKSDFTHLGRVEQLGATEDWISSLLQRKVVFPRTNSSIRCPYHTYYTARTRDAVARIYARDIELLGYDF